MANVTIFCFLASYTVTFVLEILRLKKNLVYTFLPYFFTIFTNPGLFFRFSFLKWPEMDVL